MGIFVIAALTVLLAWWVATGVILYLDGLPRRTFPRSLGVATALLAAALYGVAALRADRSATGAYLGFACGLVIWGWLEMTFLMGWITGPRRHGCDPHCRGWRHFGHAVQAIAYHEIAIVVLTAATAVAGWHGGNQVALGTLLTLWGMRLSAKLNLFLGMRNLGCELLPAHLQYLRSFLRARAMNFLFPVSTTVSAVCATLFVQRALRAGDDFATVEWTLLATLVALGLLEHWALVLPFPTNSLWSWGLRSRKAPANA